MNKAAALRHLRKNALFRDMQKGHLEAVGEVASKRQVREGGDFFQHDRQAEHFFLLLNGEVSVEVPALYGNPFVVTRLSSGDLLGWSWLFDPHRWHFDARAATATSALEFDGRVLRERCEQDHEFGYEMTKRFALLMQERLESARLSSMEEHQEL